MWNLHGNVSFVNGTIYQVVSIDQRNMVMSIISVLTLSVAFVGFVTNILNILTFYKMGLHSAINICFFALSLTDLIGECSYAHLAMIMMSMSGLIDLGADLTGILYMLLPLVLALTALGSWITAIVNLERCCWSVSRLRARRVFSRNRTIALILGMAIFQMASMVATLAGMALSETGKSTTDGIQVLIDRAATNKSMYVYLQFLTASLITVICFLIISASNSYLVIKLREKERWLGPRNELIRRAKKQVRAVVWASSAHITGLLPGCLFFQLSSQLSSSQLITRAIAAMKTCC